MKNEKDKNIKALLSQDIELPESLSQENIVRKLKENGKAKAEPAEQNVKDFSEKKKRSSRLLRIAASAAAFAVVAAGAFGVYRVTFGSNKPVATVPATAQQVADSDEKDSKQETSVQVAETTAPVYKALDIGLEKKTLSTFKSEKDLNNYFSNLAAKYKRNSYYGDMAAQNDGNLKSATMASAAAPEKAGETENNFSMENSTVSPSHSKTNTQVDGVDEGDIVKTDGRYIYVVNERYLSIIDGETMKLACQKKLRSVNSKNEISISEIYVDGNRLVVTGEEYEKSKNGNGDIFYGYEGCYSSMFRRNLVGSIVIIYDITDRENPVEVRRVSQDGQVVSSRMVGSYLYTATGYLPSFDDDEKKYTPTVDGTSLSYSEIYVKDAKDDESSYIVLSGFDTANAESTVSKTSVLASGYVTYCSQDTFYVASQEYDEKKDMEMTVLNAFSIKDGTVAYKASGIVPGCCNGQYTMDQSKGYLRIFTDGYNSKTDKDYTNLFVLDENLDVIGKLEDIAKDEELKSARFMGDTAYVVTFKNTDPLFAIDLSKPDKPKMLGELKLPGFSEYLHPLSENLLVGIGYDGDDEDADMSTLKVSLFDVSDKKNPKELSSKIVKDCFFDVNTYSAKGFVMFDENTFGIPVRKDATYITKKGEYHYSEEYTFKVFTVKNDKITLKTDYKHGKFENGSSFFRGTFIGDKVFTLDENNIRQYDMGSGKILNSLIYYTAAQEESGSDGVVAYTKVS